MAVLAVAAFAAAVIVLRDCDADDTLQGIFLLGMPAFVTLAVAACLRTNWVWRAALAVGAGAGALIVVWLVFVGTCSA